MGTGWIKLHRKLNISQMYKNLNAKQRDVFIQCLLLANHKANTWEWNGRLYECNPGQFITSLQTLSNYCSNDNSVQSIRTALLKLEKWGFLTNKSTKNGRLITICNWESYQNNEIDTNKEDNKELTKHQQSTNKVLTTNKNDKNVKNGKNEKEKNIYNADIKIIIEYLNKKLNKNFNYNATGNKKYILARLKEGYIITDFQKVIDTKYDEWINTSYKKYLRPETLFGNKFDGYLNETSVSNNPFDEFEKEYQEETNE